MATDFGSLSVRAYTAGGGLPVEGALVRITGADEGNRDIAYSLITDEDGNAGTVRLPAPNIASSIAPSPAFTPYYIYDVAVEKDGFYDRVFRGVSVFPGVNSVQLVNMIPIGGGAAEDYPRGSLDITIPDNTTL